MSFSVSPKRVASQFDHFQLPYNEGSMPPYQYSQLTYANNFQTIVRGVVTQAPTIKQQGSAVFSSACFRHCTSNLDEFWGLRVGALSLKV